MEGNALMADFRYERGREASRLLGNGIEAHRTYDAVGNLSTIQRSHETQGGEAMQYTPDHQLEDWSRGTLNETGTVVTPLDNQNWALDSRGNWTGWSHGGASETRLHSSSNEMSERRVGVVGTLLAWDSAGNLVSDGQRTFQWNHKGQLQSITAGMYSQGQYGYDPVGRRTVKTAGGLTTISVYDGWQCIWQKVTGSGTDTTKAFLYDNYIDEPIAMVRSWGTTSDTVWYLQGNNYNVEALTNRTGAIVERYAYTPYGEATVYTAPGTDGQWFTSDDVTASVSAKGNALTFQGRELDAETGVYYFRNRYYSAQMGRFVSRDPLGYGAGDVNVYRMVRNTGFSRLDPLGLEALTADALKKICKGGDMVGCALVTWDLPIYSTQLIGDGPSYRLALEKSASFSGPTYWLDQGEKFLFEGKEYTVSSDASRMIMNHEGRHWNMNNTTFYKIVDKIKELAEGCTSCDERKLKSFEAKLRVSAKTLMEQLHKKNDKALDLAEKLNFWDNGYFEYSGNYFGGDIEPAFSRFPTCPGAKQ
jgi:RHS repeat-associated protein